MHHYKMKKDQNLMVYSPFDSRATKVSLLKHFMARRESWPKSIKVISLPRFISAICMYC